MMPLLPVSAGTVAAAIVDAQHTIHAADDTADTGSDRTANCAAHGTRSAITPVNAFPRAAFHAVDDALGMRGDRQGQQRQRGCDKRESPVRRIGHEQGLSLHESISVSGLNFGPLYNVVATIKFHQVRQKNVMFTKRYTAKVNLNGRCC